MEILSQLVDFTHYIYISAFDVELQQPLEMTCKVFLLHQSKQNEMGWARTVGRYCMLWLMQHLLKTCHEHQWSKLQWTNSTGIPSLVTPDWAWSPSLILRPTNQAWMLFLTERNTEWPWSLPLQTRLPGGHFGSAAKGCSDHSILSFATGDQNLLPSF